MIPAMIATAVAPETITKVTRLFSNTAYDVICELFQNARRAGANDIAVTIINASDASYLQVVDDGHGIADPASIVTLGRSGWSDDTRRAEDPAGMGVFSLAGRDVIIRSYSQPDRQGWMAHVPALAWETSRPIAISPDPIPYGTSITIRMPEQWLATVERDVAAAALHLPVAVSLNDAQQPRKDWLADAVHVEVWNGTRIGVLNVSASHPSVKDPSLNFHGVTIPCGLPHVQETDRGRHWVARVDIVNAPEIQLVLPARKEVVENDAIAELRRSVQGALYRAVAAQGTHRLSFEQWSEARDLGIILPEAEPYLFTWIAPAADTCRNYQNGERSADPSMVLMPDLDALVAQPAARAIGAHNPFGGPLVEAKDAFKGYGWYDRLACIEAIAFDVVQGDLAFTVSDELEPPAEAEDGWVDAITLTASVSHLGAFVDVSCEADVAFTTTAQLFFPAEETPIFVRRGSALSATAVVELLESATFYSSDDSDADSYDTQLERFRRDAIERTIRLLEGDDAALERRLRDLLSGYSFIIPEDRAVCIDVRRGGLSIVISPTPPANAS